MLRASSKKVNEGSVEAYNSAVACAVFPAYISINMLHQSYISSEFVGAVLGRFGGLI
jgi:hypothetical protein